MNDSPQTIAQMLRHRAGRSHGLAVRFRQGESFGGWTWDEFREQVCRTAAALEQLGIAAGDRVAHWAGNSAQWITTDLALHLLGAVHVPIHAPLTAAQAAHQADHCGAKLMLIERIEQAEQLRARHRCEHQLLYGDASDHVEVPTDWTPLESLRARVTAGQCEALWDAADGIGSADSLATILYTSGTTGEPKGVMLSQSNLLSNASTMDRLFPSQDDSLRVCLLPLSHVFARTCDLYVWLCGHGQLAMAQSRESVIADCGELAPTSMSGVPYFFQKVQQAATAHDIQVRMLFGGRLEYFCSGGAPLPVETYDFFAQQGVPVLQGYGLTESSPVISAATREADRRGSVGQPIPDVEVRITDDGEVQTRGPHVMQGYYRNERATAEAIEDGWLKTGDLGRLDEDGYLFITGRRKELIVTSSGKNVAPVLIESLLTSDPLVEQAMVIGDDRSYLAALIVPSPTASQDLGAEELRGQVERVIESRLADLSHHEQVRRFAILPRAFSLEEGELTAKLSLRRQQIEEHWREVIEGLYSG